MQTRLLALAAIALLAGLATGCGSNGNSPGVASLGGHAGTTSPQDVAPPSGSGGNGGLQVKLNAGIKFSRCMRAHGVHNFPDPGSSGGLTLNSTSGIDPRSQTFRDAQQACAKDLPNGGRPSPQQLAKMKRAALAFSACMRAHGLKDFPDPTFGSGGLGIAIRIRSSQGNNLDPSNPAFQRAQAACNSFLPKGKG